uniref:Guided entry of tail-anchored proteins factor 1 n=1 Tax=Clastoptera arizonana TaxID=38151 RepID=A0A1B6D5J3_9HEMI
MKEDDSLNITLLLIGFFINLVNVFLSHLLKPVLSAFNKNKEKFNDLREEIAELKFNLSKISVVDEFAKFARLQRSLNTLQTKLNDGVKAEESSSVKIQMIISYSARVVMEYTNHHLTSTMVAAV